MKTGKEKFEIIKKLIPDSNLRHVIFNFEDADEDFLSDEKNCLLYFSNIMVFSMLLIWSAFLNWKKGINGKTIEGNNSFWRIYNMMDKVCDPTKINGEFVDDLLINLEIDCLLDTDTSSSFVEAVDLTAFFKFSQKSNKLARYIYLVKQRRLSSRIPATEFNFEEFCESINMFAYLRDSKLKFINIGAITKENQSDLQKIILDCSEIYGTSIKLIDFNYSLCLINDIGTYYMEDCAVNDARHFDEDGKKEQSITINYVQFGGSDDFSLFLTDDIGYTSDVEYVIKKNTAIEEFFLDYDIINTYKNSINNTFFRDYILLNNRYLKELSYTISDALSLQLKNVIIAKYSPKYKEIFDKMYISSLYNKKEAIGYRWDEIVLFLLMEEGVNEFLRVLLCNGGDYESFLKAFQRRFGKERVNDVLKKEVFIANPEGRLPSGTSEYAKIDCRAKALVMLATKILTQNDWALEKSIYPTTIEDIISECNRIYLVPQYSESEKIIYLSNVVLHVVRFITKFYKGVFQYARKKKQSLLDLEASDGYYDDYKQYNKAKETWIDEMKRTIAINDGKKSDNSSNGYFSSSKIETAEKIKAAFKQLLSMNNEYSSHNNNQNEILFDVLGRQYLFVSNKMQSYGEDIAFILEQKTENITDALYESVKNFLLYLKTGLDDNEREISQNDLIELAIYPIVGQYCSGVTSFDGYRYSLFKVSSIKQLDDSHTFTIKMITDDEFDFGYSYYCIPNINRIANVKQEYTYDKIWVSPIIIPCSVYLPQSLSQLEPLSDEKDFDAAIELIYESDVFIGEKLFGSLDNAKKILPLLFNNPQSKFYKGHYRIIRDNQEIIAIASIYGDSTSFWDYDIVKTAFDDIGLMPPTTFDIAIKNLKETFNEYFGKNYYHIDNVCVKTSYRHQGIGRSLMMYLLKMAEKANKSVRLFVYKDNYVAYNLYSSLGFVPITKQFTIDNSNEYFQMVKI